MVICLIVLKPLQIDSPLALYKNRILYHIPHSLPFNMHFIKSISRNIQIGVWKIIVDEISPLLFQVSYNIINIFGFDFSVGPILILLGIPLGIISQNLLGKHFRIVITIHFNIVTVDTLWEYLSTVFLFAAKPMHQ